MILEQLKNLPFIWEIWQLDFLFPIEKFVKRRSTDSSTNGFLLYLASNESFELDTMCSNLRSWYWLYIWLTPETISY